MHIPSFCLPISPSRWMRAYLVMLHFLLMLAVIIVPVSPGFQWLAAGLIMVHGRYSHIRYLTTSHIHWVGRIDYVNQHWLLSGPGHKTRVWLKHATVWRWLIVLNFYAEHNNRHYSVTLWPDSTDRDTLRRLRACLRHMPVFGNSKTS